MVGCGDVLCVAEQVQILCLLRFGVDGSFYLNAKKINVCRLIELYKFVCKLRASSVQVCARAMQKLCMFSCNAFVLHVPKEEFVNFILRCDLEDLVSGYH